jgi:hypothetical protein
MADVQRHVRECIECRTQLDAYQEVSRTFDAYLDATVASKSQRRVPCPVRVLGVAGAVGLAAVLLVSYHTRVEPPVPPSSVKAAPSALVLEAAPAPAPARRVHRPRSVAPVQNQIAINWPPTQPAIQIAIPAESMFPPGAMPEGINFTADLSIAADGSAQEMRLQPRLILFERRAIQP